MTTDWVPLTKLARVSLGFKSLQNDFFYVNEATVNTFGIERRFLIPILTLSDMDAACFLQKSSPELYLFACSETETALRGTGALRYIRTMANKTAASKKQSDKPQTIEEVLEKQGGSTWYAPKASPVRAHIWIRKAFGDCYSPFLFEGPVLVDQRCNKIEPVAGLDWSVVAAYMTSSVFSLSLEVNGAAGLGGGALEVTTTKLQDILVPDLANWNESQRRALVELANDVWSKSAPRSWRTAPKSGKELHKLDSFVLDSVAPRVRVERMYADLTEVCASRYLLADDKKRSFRQKTSTDLSSVARSIVESVQPMLEAHRFPEDFQTADTGTMTVRLESTRPLVLIFHSLLDQAKLSIQGEAGKTEFEYEGPVAVAELIWRCALLGRREFEVTTDRGDAQEALDKFFPWIEKITQRATTSIQSSALGTGYEAALKERVFGLLRIHHDVDLKQLPVQLTLDPT
jgi:hypothetical protein